MLYCLLEAFVNILLLILQPFFTYVNGLKPGFYQDALVAFYGVFLVNLPAVVIGTIFLGLSHLIPVTLGCPYLTSVSRKMARISFGMSRLTWYIYYRTQTAVEDILSVIFVFGTTCTSFVLGALVQLFSWLLWVPVVLTSTIWKYTVGFSNRTLLTLSSVMAFRKSTVPLVIPHSSTLCGALSLLDLEPIALPCMLASFSTLSSESTLALSPTSTVMFLSGSSSFSLPSSPLPSFENILASSSAAGPFFALPVDSSPPFSPRSTLPSSVSSSSVLSPSGSSPFSLLLSPPSFGSILASSSAAGPLVNGFEHHSSSSSDSWATALSPSPSMLSLSPSSGSTPFLLPPSPSLSFRSILASSSAAGPLSSPRVPSTADNNLQEQSAPPSPSSSALVSSPSGSIPFSLPPSPCPSFGSILASSSAMGPFTSSPRPDKNLEQQSPALPEDSPLLQVSNDNGQYNSPILPLVAWRPLKTTTSGSLLAPDIDTSTPDLELSSPDSADEDIEEIFSPQALNESYVQPYLDTLLVGLPDSGWGRLAFLKTNVELLLVLETTWACPLLTQAIIEARAAVREAKATSFHA